MPFAPHAPTRLALAVGVLATLAIGLAHAQGAIPPSLVTPDRVETRLGTLDFKDGAPSAPTLAKVYDNLDSTHAYEAFVNTYQGVSMAAIRKGMLNIGVKDNEVLIWSSLLDAKSLMLTGNADTVYTFAVIDLTKGPMVLETPPDALGTIDDMWQRWVTDFGAPGPDRGKGGKYLIVPPGYTGQLPQGGYFITHAKTSRVIAFGRAFMVNNDPKPAVEVIRNFTRIYPYEAGGVGTSIAEFLTGKAKLARIETPPPVVFHEGSGKVMNTIAPNDYSYYELLDELVQQEPTATLDPELMGSIAAIGIIKGKPFAPDARMKKILTDAVALANATSRSLALSPRDPTWLYYPHSNWVNPMFVSGSEWETPIPLVTREGVKPFPPTGYRTLDARTAFLYAAIGVTPAMAMRLPGVGSQYLWTTLDADKNYFDGAKTYKVTLPKGIPAEKFWSFTLYDNQSRSMLDTPQRHPRAGSQSYPSPAAEPNADGSTTVFFAPRQPDGVKRGNWIQTMPGKGWWVLLRLYSPLEPFFAKTWQLSEVELVK